MAEAGNAVTAWNTHRRDLLDSEPSPGQPAGLRLDSEHQPKKKLAEAGYQQRSELDGGRPWLV